MYNIVLFENQPSDLIRLDIYGKFIFQTKILKWWEIFAIYDVKKILNPQCCVK